MSGAMYTNGFVFHEDHVLLLQKSKPEFQLGKWNGLGGKIEWFETPLDTMIREFEEEAGVRLEGWEEFATYNFSPDGGFVVFYRLFLPERIEVNSVSDTGDPIVWFPIGDLPVTMPNVKWLVPMAYHDRDTKFDCPYQIYTNGYIKIDNHTKGL